MLGAVALSVHLLIFSLSATPQTVTISEGDDNFEAAIVSIGMFGVISEVTMRVQNAFNLKEIRRSTYFNYCMDNLDELVRSAKYVKFWVEFYNDLCVIYQTDETADVIEDNPGGLLSFLTVRL